MFHLAIFHHLPRAFSWYHLFPAAFTHHLPPKGHRTLEFYKTFLQDLAFAYREPTSQQWCHWQDLQHTVGVVACLQKPWEGQSVMSQHDVGGQISMIYLDSLRFRIAWNVNLWKIPGSQEEPHLDLSKDPLRTSKGLKSQETQNASLSKKNNIFKEKQHDPPDFLMVGLAVLYACNVQAFIHTTDSHLPANAQASISALTQSPCEASGRWMVGCGWFKKNISISWLYMTWIHPVNQW